MTPAQNGRTCGPDRAGEGHGTREMSWARQSLSSRCECDRPGRRVLSRAGRGHGSAARRPECRFLRQSLAGVHWQAMSRPVKSKKRYKPIGFGDRYDPESVEGHLNAVAEAWLAPPKQ